MYADYLMLKLGPGQQSVGQGLADKFSPVMKAAKGFRGVTFFADYDAGEYGALMLWESKEDYQAFHDIAFPQLQQATAGVVKEAPVIKLYDVYEPKS